MEKKYLHSTCVDLTVTHHNQSYRFEIPTKVYLSFIKIIDLYDSSDKEIVFNLKKAK